MIVELISGIKQTHENKQTVCKQIGLIRLIIWSTC